MTNGAHSKSSRHGGIKMKKLLPKLLIMFFCTGCAGISSPTISPSFSGFGGQQPLLQSTTAVQLTSRNYRIVKTNAVGSDWGINLLGLIPLVSPDYVKVVKELYEAGGVAEGKPQAIVNVVQQQTSPYFILFSIPRITIRADVVEFKEPVP
jgi:hypothetical protein